MKWEYLFKGPILERGYDYYTSGAVTELETDDALELSLFMIEFLRELDIDDSDGYITSLLYVCEEILRDIIDECGEGTKKKAFVSSAGELLKTFSKAPSRYAYLESLEILFNKTIDITAYITVIASMTIHILIKLPEVYSNIFSKLRAIPPAEGKLFKSLDIPSDATDHLLIVK